MCKTIQVDNTLSTTIDVADLQTGVYLLELKNETDKSWKKIVIE
ncbi:MAG: T9SS type A sorting domain-containing protein [Flavobacterium sp.]|nr:T9SS type A sorting domain-containing protein [Flavobacterium sp.]